MKTAIFCQIKDERDYLDDFLSYHVNLGIEKIFLFEDINSEPHDDICAKYGDRVELIPVTRLFTLEKIAKLKRFNMFQSQTIKEGFVYIKNNYCCDWCFSIDADEFITVEKPLDDVLCLYNYYDAIMIEWLNYGYSGYIHKPIHNKPIYEIFTEKCGNTAFDVRNHVTAKFVFNMNRFEKRFIGGSHYALCNYVKPDFSQNRDDLVYDNIYLRHYITKSFDEYMWKMHKRGNLQIKHRSLNDFYEINPQAKAEVEKIYGTTDEALLVEKILK